MEESMNDKTTLVAGAAALAIAAAGSMLSATAAAEPIPRAVSYADLLEPVPDAAARLAADDAAVRSRSANLIRVQYWGGYDGPYYHHHHHHHVRRWYYPNGYYWDGYEWVRRPIYHHHHHHHHQWDY
jgi:hypothetical protein